MLCPKCGSDKVYSSRLKNDNEFFITMVTSFSPYRCTTCQHRWWRFRFRPRRRGDRRSLLPDVRGGFKRLRRDLTLWWPENRGRIIPIAFKALLIGGLAVVIAMIISYSTGRMKDTTQMGNPVKAVKK